MAGVPKSMQGWLTMGLVVLVIMGIANRIPQIRSLVNP